MENKMSKKEMTPQEVDEHNSAISKEIGELNKEHEAKLVELKSQMKSVKIHQATLAECNAMAKKNRLAKVEVKPAAPKKG